MISFEKICQYHFELSQKNWVWFPFTFLRPQAHEFLSYPRLLTMSLCFGIYFYAFNLLRSWMMGRNLNLSLEEIAYFNLGFLIWFSSVTRPLWNWWVKNKSLG